jgi:hypothetical protein
MGRTRRVTGLQWSSCSRCVGERVVLYLTILTCTVLPQVRDLIYCLHVLYPDYQIVAEFDSSSSHLKTKVDGLSSRSMSHSGAQKHMRSSLMTVGCVADGAMLKVGDTQHMQFGEGDAGPWYDPDAQRVTLRWSGMTDEQKLQYKDKKQKYEGKAVTAAIKKLKKERSNRHGAVIDEEAVRAAVVEALPEFCLPGWLGEPKGIKQILWERGFWKDGMHMPYDAATRAAKLEKGLTIDDSLDASAVLCALLDFQQERTLLDAELDKTGDVVLYSPKCHPELAGVGIEYCFGYAKMRFRREFNDAINANLYDNTIKSLNAVSLEKGWTFSRRSRDYLLVYRALEESGYEANGEIDLTGAPKISHAKLEDMRKACKSHRNIHDIEIKFLTAELQCESEKKQTKVRRNRLPDLTDVYSWVNN